MRRRGIPAAYFLPVLLVCPPVGAAPGGGSSPERIVSLAPSVTEILFELDLGDRIVGVTGFCDFPPEALEKATVGGFANPSAERIVSLRPDLVIAVPNVGNRSAVETVRRLGLTVLVVEAGNLDELYGSIGEIGEATGTFRRAEALVSDLRREISSLAETVRGRRPPSVLLAFSRDPFIVAGRSSFPAELIRIAGGRIPVSGGGGSYPRLGIEKILEIAPEVILQPISGSHLAASLEADLLRSWSRWPALPAVSGGRIHPIHSDLILRPGPRVPEGIRELIRILHPGVLKEASTDGGTDD